MELVKSCTNLKSETEETEEERIDRLMSEEFDKHYSSFEDFKKDFCKKIDQALQEVKDGKCRPFEEFCAEMEAKYHIYD